MIGNKRNNSGFTAVEFLVVAIALLLILAIAYKNYQQAVLEERRQLAMQSMITVAGLQERWFLRMFKYAKTIDDVGGGDIAGEHYDFKITQDPCGSEKCYTIIARAKGRQEKDIECDVMTLNSVGQRHALSRSNEVTTSECWKNN